MSNKAPLTGEVILTGKSAHAVIGCTRCTVPISDLTDFARLVLAMRRAQKRAEKREASAIREARDLERRVDYRAKEVLLSEKRSLPLEEGGSS